MYQAMSVLLPTDTQPGFMVRGEEATHQSDRSAAVQRTMTFLEKTNVSAWFGVRTM